MNINNKQESQEVGQALLNDVTRDNLGDLISDISEVVFDQFMNEGVLKELPIIGTVIKFYRASVGFRESLLIEKLRKLLNEIKHIPARKRKEYINKLEENPSYSHTVGQRLIMIIDQLDDMDKPSIIGKLFKAAINEDITYEMFLRLSSIVQKAFLPDLLKLKAVPDLKKLSTLTKEQYVTLGVMSIGINPQGKKMIIPSSIGLAASSKDLPSLTYEVNSIGKKLIMFGLNDNTNAADSYQSSDSSA